jgi:hypothetical protein
LPAGRNQPEVADSCSRERKQITVQQGDVAFIGGNQTVSVTSWLGQELVSMNSSGEVQGTAFWQKIEDQMYAPLV